MALETGRPGAGAGVLPEKTRADSGGAALAGRDKMVKALKKLESLGLAESLPKEVEAFAISGGINELLSTHPPLSKRIEALKRQ